MLISTKPMEVDFFLFLDFVINTRYNKQDIDISITSHIPGHSTQRQDFVINKRYSKQRTSTYLLTKIFLDTLNPKTVKVH